MTKKQRHPSNSAHHAHMRMRQVQNLAKCVHNPNENWMAEKLKSTGLKWTRQAQWGFRLFDFWNHILGIAVEVDGPEHDPSFEMERFVQPKSKRHPCSACEESQ